MAKRLYIDAVFRAVDKVSRPLKRMRGKVARFGRTAALHLKAVDRVGSKVARTLGRDLKRGIQGATVALLAFGVVAKKVIDTGAEFEQTLVIASTKFQGGIKRGTEQFEGLEEAARKTGATTEFTATQSAMALKFLGAAGLDLNQAIAVLPTTVDLATAAEVGLGEAADMSVKALGALGMASEDAATNQAQLTRVMDVMKNASDSASQELTDVYEAMVKGGPTAKMFGQNVETLSASIIGMARAGIIGQEAGTAYRNIMLRLADAGGPAAKVLKKLGVTVRDSAKNLRDPIVIISELSKKLNKLGTAERATMMSKIFGLRAVTGASALLKQGAKALDGFKKSSEEAQGSVGRAAKEIRNTMAGSMKNLGSAVESVKISLSKLKRVAIKGVVDKMTEWIRANEKLIASKVGDFIKSIIDNFDKIVAAIKKVGAVLGIIFGVIGAIKLFSIVLKGVMLLVSMNPFVLLLGALGALILYFADLDDIIAFVKNNLETIIKVAKGVGVAIGIIFGLVAAFKVLAGAIAIVNFVMALNPIVLIVTAIIAVVAVAAGLIIAYWDEISEAFIHAWTVVKNFFVGTWGTISTAFTIAWGEIENSFASVWESIKSIFSKAVKYLINSGPLGMMIRAAKVLIENWSEVKGFFGRLWDGIVSTFKSGVDRVKRFIKPLTDLYDRVVGNKSKVAGGGLRVIDGGRSDSDMGVSESSPGGYYPQLVSPQDRTARSIEERNLTTHYESEVTIRDETGRAEVTKGELGTGLKMQRTGSF